MVAQVLYQWDWIEIFNAGKFQRVDGVKLKYQEMRPEAKPEI